VPSTVVDLTVTPARVLREGAVAREAIAEVVDLEA
jgi:tRNA A37 threonylcarbamoyladenosine synthetase subunit TsaC/SUA5/YrdC